MKNINSIQRLNFQKMDFKAYALHRDNTQAWELRSGA